MRESKEIRYGCLRLFAHGDIVAAAERAHGEGFLL
jgi:hypothetical protein